MESPRVDRNRADNSAAAGLSPLPIDPLLPEVVRSLSTLPRLVLAAPPGAGKTTRVPRALLDAGLGEAGEIVVLEPRRVAARMAARRVAEELGEEVGQTVGYQVRFEDVSSAKTRIRFVTEGVLTRKLLGDPSLRGVSAVLLDEFHERHLQGDLALALLGASPLAERRLVVMSATLAAEPIAAFLGAPILRAEGRLFDVAVENLPAPDDRRLELQVASAVRRLAREGLDGDVLVFLPGAAEIRRAREACEAVAGEYGLEVLALHGDMAPAEQDLVVGRTRAASRGLARRVILSTNVAESSVTIDGVVAVVDSGLARVASHAAWSGLSRLRLEKTSKASAAQRAGRAGRTRPGRCLRLYTKADELSRADHEVPEIRRADLAQTTLELRAAGALSPAWFEPPPAESVRAAEELLGRLGALDAAGAVTPLGKAMAKAGVHPRLARLALEGAARGVAEDACALAALLGERDPRRDARAGFGDQGAGRRGGGATERSDVLAILGAFQEAEAAGFRANAIRAIGLDMGATLAASRAKKQLARHVGRGSAAAPKSAAAYEAELLKCVLAAYPDRVAKRLRPGARAVAVAGVGPAELSEASAVRDAEWVVAVDAEDGSAASPGRRLVRVASAIEPDWLIELFPDAVREITETKWNAGMERVDAVNRITYLGLALHEAPASASSLASSDAVATALAEHAEDAGPRRFAPDGELDRWLARARFAGSVDASIAPPSEDDVRAALRAMCTGKRSFAELREENLLEVLRRDMGHARAAAVERLAPERITLTAGRAAAVSYEPGKPPWIETYLQDFFGMAKTPAVGDGRVPLVVHLWAPNKRAVQVTSDLAGFWERSYPAVRKELMRRYPRHSWPEDPTVPIPRFRRDAH